MSSDGETGQWVRSDRRVRTIPTTCRIHGTSGFCALRVATAEDGDIELHVELHPHGDTGGGGVGCVSVLTGDAANALFDALGEWLG